MSSALFDRNDRLLAAIDRAVARWTRIALRVSGVSQVRRIESQTATGEPVRVTVTISVAPREEGQP